MPRPRRWRRVWFDPSVTYFKPAGVRRRDLKESVLGVDEFEAVRLKDMLGLGQKEAAEKMNISQPTFHRLVLGARKNIADAIVNGKSIRIRGGDFKMVEPETEKGFGAGMGRGSGKGSGRGQGVGRSGGRGRMGGPFSAGPAGMCKCPECGYEIPHATSKPCMQTKCPKCGSLMARG